MFSLLTPTPTPPEDDISDHEEEDIILQKNEVVREFKIFPLNNEVCKLLVKDVKDFIMKWLKSSQTNNPDPIWQIVFTDPNQNHIELFLNHISPVWEGTFTSSEIIDAWAYILVGGDKQAGSNTFFMPSNIWNYIIVTPSCQIIADNALKRAVEYGCETIAFPVNTPGRNQYPMHWMLLVFNRIDCTWKLLNSLMTRRKSKYQQKADAHYNDVQKLANYMQRRYNALMENEADKIDIPSIVYQDDCPQQESGTNDCGIFVMFFMECLKNRAKIPKDLTPLQIRRIKARIITTIVNDNNAWNPFNRKESQDSLDEVLSDVNLDAIIDMATKNKT